MLAARRAELASLSPRYPAGDLDQPELLIAALGSFWDEAYAGRALVRSILAARAHLERQARQDHGELIASLSRLTVPATHVLEWSPLVLREQDRQGTVLPRYDGAYRHTDPGTIAYDEAVPAPFVRWALPPDLVQVPVLANRIHAASICWTQGVDYRVTAGLIEFLVDPFTQVFSIREVYEGDQVVDRELTLWAYRARQDRDTIGQQFGYVLGQLFPATPQGRDVLNAAWDALVLGTSARPVDQALAALADAPLAAEDGETVLHTLADDAAQWVITDRHAYRCGLGATVIVGIGDLLVAGQALTDAVLVFELGEAVPPAEQVPALVLGPGLLGLGFDQPLSLPNAESPLEISTRDGWTVVEFPIDGLPSDVDRFWEVVHARGVASGKTLAMCLDQRAVPEGQPTEAALPATVNPLGLVAANLLSGALSLAVVRPGSFGPDAPGLARPGLLRRLTPPHTALGITLRLTLDRETLIMDAPGDEERAGCVETVTTFDCVGLAETLDPEELVTETIRTRQVGGRCI